MKKIFLLLILVFNSMLCFAVVSDPITANITGYVMKSSDNNKSVYFTITHNDADTSSDDPVQIGSDYVGTDLKKMFSWNFGGNYYRTRKNGWSGDLLYNYLVIKYTISPLTSKKGQGEDYLPFSYEFDADYTYVNTYYLGSQGYWINNSIKILTDTIEVETEGTDIEIDGIDVGGKIVDSPHVIKYKYKMNNDPSYRYKWTRSGDIYIGISESDYENAEASTYRCTITIEIYEEE